MERDENLVTQMKRDKNGFIEDVDNLIANATDRAEIFNKNQGSNVVPRDGEGEPESTQGRSFETSDEKVIG